MQCYKAVIKPTGNECCSNGIGDWKINIAPNTAKVTNMIEAAATCQRNMFSEIKIAIKCNTKITYTVSDGVMLWQTMFVGKKWASLLRCLDVPIMMKSVLLALSISLLFVIQPDIPLRQSTSCLRERSVSAVDKDMYTWVSSAYKWWSNLWLWISELMVRYSE